MIDLSRYHTSTQATHIADVCIWHNKQEQRPGAADREWAKTWLDEHERKETLTPAEANEIRELCGWNKPTQLSLLNPTPRGI